MKHRPIEVRFWEKVERTEDESACWSWVGAKHPDGRGHIYYEGRAHNAPRIAWMLAYGPISDGMEILHTCDNPNCVNPSHLRLGTHYENMADMLAKRRNRGGQGGGSRISFEQAQTIRSQAAAGRKRSELARQYGVSKGLIDQIVSGKSHNHRPYDVEEE